MKFSNQTSNSIMLGPILFPVGQPVEISGYSLSKDDINSFGKAIANNQLLPLDADAKRFIGINNLAPALFNLPDNNSNADGLVPALASLNPDGSTAGVVGSDGRLKPLNFGLKNTMALIGDSITLRNLPPVSGGFRYYGSDGYFTVANVMMDSKFELVGVSGNSGQTSTYILSRVVPDILSISPLPRYCMVLAGTNDEPSGFTVDQTVLNLKAIYDLLVSNGIAPIICTLPPRNDAGMMQLKKRNDVRRNRWIREYARANDVICCDFYRVLVNPTLSGTGGWALASDNVGAVVDTSIDQIHPNNYGGWLMATEVVRRLSPRLNTQSKGGAPAYSDNMYINGQAAILEGNIIPNGTFHGVAGNLGATATGTLGNEWSVQSCAVPAGAGTVVLSKVNKTDTFGTWQQINISGGNAGDVQGSCSLRSDQDYPSAFAQLGPTTWQVGDSVFGQMSFETDAANWAGTLGDTNCNVSLRIQFFGSTDTMTDVACFLDGAGASRHRMASGVLRTPTIQIPVGTTRLYLWAYFRGRGVIRFGDAEIRKMIAI